MPSHDEKSPLLLSPWQHRLSTVALCFVAFTHSYLLISVFPYRYECINMYRGTATRALLLQDFQRKRMLQSHVCPSSCLLLRQ
jgi:hypothetical protein